MDRRDFLKLASVAAGSALARPSAGSVSVRSESSAAILVDLGNCAGCRSCEEACAYANELPEPDWSDDFSYDSARERTPAQWTTVNLHETSEGEIYVKGQCMHCIQPACAAACLTKAMLKTPEGPVVWREDKCMGCRYCMVSCPFDVPKFEYHSAVPKIQKCRMCWERLLEGSTPACVEECPNDALTFGDRDELLQIARARIYGNPDGYVPHIYGEHEAGGTSLLYISPVPFEELGFRTDLGETAYPEYTRDFLTAVPLVLIIWPAMLLGLRQAATQAGSDAVDAELLEGGDV